MSYTGITFDASLAAVSGFLAGAGFDRARVPAFLLGLVLVIALLFILRHDVRELIEDARRQAVRQDRRARGGDA